MKTIIAISLLAFGFSGHAEVFKCVVNDKTVYQPTPCPAAAVKQAEIVIEKPDPAKEAEAEAKLKAWQEDFARRESEDRKAQKERQAELDRQAEIDALNRSARAQEELAEAAQQQQTINNHPYGGYPYPHYNGWGFGGYQRPHGYGFGYPPRPVYEPPQHQPQQPRPTQRRLAQ